MEISRVLKVDRIRHIFRYFHHRQLFIQKSQRRIIKSKGKLHECFCRTQ
jgi:hypothetical protein